MLSSSKRAGPYIRTAAVLGAGTMGAQLAAHLANAGVPVLLLDVTAEAAAAGLARARTLSPDPFFLPEYASRIRTGSFDEGLAEAGACDWIVEAIVEQLDAKRALFERLAPHLKSGAIVTTNTSALPISDLRIQQFSAHHLTSFCGTHFFNPPRYLPLVELIPTEATDPAVVDRLRAFLDVRLGKGVVIARDVPGFIANRIATYGMARALALVADGSYTVDEVDALTGPLIGRPKSATFRTADIVGLDVLAKVAGDLHAALGDDAFALPAFVEAMVREGAVGEKAGRGFYRKVKVDGATAIHTRNIATGEYRPRAQVTFPSVEAARAIDDIGERLKRLAQADDRAGAFLRATLGATIAYAARVADDIAYDPADIDRAMRLGFGWALGPFESAKFFPVQFSRLNVQIPPRQPGKLNRDEFRGNAAASLRDLGDGVLGVALHSKLNTLGGDTLEMLETGVATAAADGYTGIVVGTDAQHFSAGANLMLLLLAAQDGDWDEIDLMVRAFQRATMALRLAPVPVVVATNGMTLGGGCEIALHADRVQAAAESYIGLVETGVGLIPAGGGTKEMLARAMETLARVSGPAADVLPAVSRAFETMAFAKVSTSAPHARQLGYLSDADGLTMNRERLIDDAKRVAMARAAEGYQPTLAREAIPVGGPDVFAALSLGVHLARRAERISDHDARVGRALARVMTGGDVAHRTTLTEQQVLDLEREAFLSLMGTPETQARIAHTLRTGKPLRN